MTLGHVDFLIWFASDIDIVVWAGPKREIEQGMAGLTIFFFNQVSTEFRGKSRVR